jgi:hypothetical protein
MSEEYNYISKKFLRKGHYWKATDEPCKCGEDFIVLRREGMEAEMKTLKENEMINPKICVLKAEVRDKLF